LVIGANLFVTAVLGFYALRIRVEFSTASILPTGDPEIEYYENVKRTFGSDIAIVGVRADDTFAPATLEKIARVTAAVAKIKESVGSRASPMLRIRPRIFNAGSRRLFLESH
jgi:predicted RND superfamily exporter protein